MCFSMTFLILVKTFMFAGRCGQDRIPCNYQRGQVFLVAQMVKNLPAMQETRDQSLCWEDPLEKGMSIHSSILTWRIPWTEEPGGLQSMGLQRVRHDWVTNTTTIREDKSHRERSTVYPHCTPLALYYCVLAICFHFLMAVFFLKMMDNSFVGISVGSDTVLDQSVYYQWNRNWTFQFLHPTLITGDCELITRLEHKASIHGSKLQTLHSEGVCTESGKVSLPCRKSWGLFYLTVTD